jgi:hypothetical protein
MRSGILVGSALALAVLGIGSTQAAACDDDCDYCGYGYYGASYYGYYARPAYAYAPGPYAAPAYAYYAPAYYYAPAPAYYAPQPYYGYGGYGRPYYGWRGGYVDAGARRHGVAPGAPPPARGMYAAAKPAPRTAKAPTPAYVAPAVIKAPKPNRAAPGILAAAPKPPKPAFGTPGLPATVAKHAKPDARFPVASYGPQPKYVPTAYYTGPVGYPGLRR